MYGPPSKLNVIPLAAVIVTIPVETVHVGCVILIFGTAGVPMNGLMVIFRVAKEVQPTEFVTVNAYVHAVNSGTV